MKHKYEKLYLRSITYTVDLKKIESLAYQNKVSRHLKEIHERFISEGIFVRTLRFNILKIEPEDRIDKFRFLKKIKVLSNFSKNIGIRWFNVAFDLTNLGFKDIRVIGKISYEIIKRYKNSFINFIVADKEKINPYAIKMASEVILNISTLSFNGYDNFRVGVSVNPANNTPFFPFSYADKDLGFSLAVETTSKIVQLIEDNKNLSLEKLKELIVTQLSPFVQDVQRISEKCCEEFDMEYRGQDLSLAPFPDNQTSVISILHLLGLDNIGSSGTLYFTAFLTNLIKTVIKKNNILKAGFNGVMYSLLEDHLMCKANDMKLLSIDNIISYSSLCGCGLDMVPIPGNTLVEELGSMILDVAALAIRLDKPLGVRVLPIPNKGINEFTEFDMDFLTNTRILSVKNNSCAARIFENTAISILGKE